MEFFYIAGFDSNGSKCYKPSKNGKIPPLEWMFEEGFVNYRDDERRGLDVGVTPATLVREVVAGTPSIMGG